MKIKIIYSTKSGTVADCVELLKNELDMCFIDSSRVEDCREVPDGYDMIIIGFYVRFGKPSKAMRRFITDNYEKLKKQKLGIFICCGYSDSFDEYVEKNLPLPLKEHAFEISCFGGRLEPSYNKGIEKMFVKTLRNDILSGGENGDEKVGRTLPTILENNIVQFAEKIKCSPNNRKK